jgi:hypothetical protein
MRIIFTLVSTILLFLQAINFAEAYTGFCKEGCESGYSCTPMAWAQIPARNIYDTYGIIGNLNYPSATSKIGANAVYVIPLANSYRCVSNKDGLPRSTYGIPSIIWGWNLGVSP